VPPLIRIAPRPGWRAVEFRELWHYRELALFLAMRDLKVRYKQTLLGAAWAVIQPVTAMVVFSIFFGKLAKMPSDGIPYPIFAYCALLPWQFFSATVSHAGNSMVDNAHVITKIYFPRLLVPLSSVMSGLVDFAIAFLVLVGLMAFYGIVPSLAVLALPLFLLLAIAASIGVSLWLAALNVEYRDIRYTIPFLLQVWMFLTPVVYPASLLSPAVQMLYAINPLVGVVEGFRWAMLGHDQAPVMAVLVSVASAAVLLVSGLYYFRRVEKTFADLV
jgi:lipopolysaccharide transport system permease protein